MDGRKEKGSITVFLSLTCILFLALICTAVESARVQGAKTQTANVAGMGNFSVLGEFEKELLDEYDRNDSIFITRNRNGITVENLSNILKRNDLKKSDAYQSNFLEGTTPMYEAYIRLKKSVAAALK